MWMHGGVRWNWARSVEFVAVVENAAQIGGEREILPAEILKFFRQLRIEAFFRIAETRLRGLGELGHGLWHRAMQKPAAARGIDLDQTAAKRKRPYYLSGPG